VSKPHCYIIVLIPVTHEWKLTLVNKKQAAGKSLLHGPCK